MINYSHKIVLRRDSVRKDGLAPLVLQAFLGGTRVRLNLNLFVKPADFDSEKMQVKIKGDPESTTRINAVLAKYKSRVEEMFFEARMSGAALSESTFREEIDNRPALASFLEFIAKEIEKEKTDREPATINVYKTTLDWLTRFREKVAFTDVTFEFVQEFDRFMKKAGLHQNTRAKYHRMVRKFVLLAINKRRRVRNPYKEFKFKELKTEPVWLSVQEVESLVDLYESQTLDPVLQRVLRYFLFQIVTSLRISDVMSLKKSAIENGMLAFNPQKGKRFGKIVKIPMSDLAKKLVADAGSEGKDDKLFATPPAATINLDLKIIGEAAGIKKVLKTHVGRHTFGFLYLLMGGKVEELREIMGHSKLETTMIYTHTDYSMKLAGVRRFDQIFKPVVAGSSPSAPRF